MGTVIRAETAVMGGLVMLLSAAIFLLAVFGRKLLLVPEEHRGFRLRVIFNYVMFLASACVTAYALLILNVLYPNFFASLFSAGR